MMVFEGRDSFRDRLDAGRRLAEKLIRYSNTASVVLAVPRGGVPVAVEVAGKIGASLDIIVPRKITIPYNPEAGYGAVNEDGSIVLNQPLVKQLGLTEFQIQEQARAVQAEIQRRINVFRTVLPASTLEGKTTIIIDDGLASGFTMLAAVKSARRRKANRIVVAVPVASSRAYDLVKPEVDEIECLIVANSYPFAVANYYRNWYDLDDEEVLNYLKEWQQRESLSAA